MDVDTVIKSFDSFSLAELQKCKDSLLRCILNKINPSNNSISPGDFVDFHSDFISPNSVQYKKVCSELRELNFKPSSDIAATKWLTSTGEDYVWSSANGKQTVKQPVNIAEYPGILHLMHDINTKFGCHLNSCLVSYYKSGSSKTRYHCDDESSLDNSQGLYVISLGTERTLDLNLKGKDGRFKPDFSLTTKDGSLYIMKPGCQDFCVHRVRGRAVSGVNVSACHFDV